MNTGNQDHYIDFLNRISEKINNKIENLSALRLKHGLINSLVDTCCNKPVINEGIKFPYKSILIYVKQFFKSP